MPRPYKPIVLPLKPITGVDVDASEARCPRCERREALPQGRLGLRVVFRCQACKVNFFNHAPAPQRKTA